MNNELSWEDLLVNNKINQSLIEYIDAAEQNYSLIAMNKKSFKNKETKYYKYIIVKYILPPYLESGQLYSLSNLSQKYISMCYG